MEPEEVGPVGGVEAYQQQVEITPDGKLAAPTAPVAAEPNMSVDAASDDD